MKSTLRKAAYWLLLTVFLSAMAGGGTVWGQKSKNARFVIKQGRLYGYINASGRIAIKPQFARALPFSGNLALIKKGKLYGYINPRGKMVSGPVLGWPVFFPVAWPRCGWASGGGISPAGGK